VPPRCAVDAGVFAVSPTATTPITAGVDEPFGVTVDGSGKIYLANCCNGISGAGSISTYLPDGTPTTPTITTGANNSLSVVVDLMGNIYVANSISQNIQIYNSTGGTPTSTISTGFNATTVAVY
jgi:hypothetical protein